ncbi:MAG: RNA polymerase factor sigma-54 [Acidobacteriota bacterium]|nr:RNA polymerase factor sigma-54 [Acidobacteriota bacterium]
MSRRAQLKPSLVLGLSQRLAITPSLLQKIELLSVNQLELSEILQQELEENPLLDDVSDHFEAGPEVSEPARESEQDADPPEEGSHLEDLDFDYFFGDYLGSSYERQEFEPVEQKATFEQFLSSADTLWDYLNWQLNLNGMDPDLREIAHFIVGNLDEDGYLTLTPKEICRQLQVPSGRVDDALAAVQSLDPVGVACRDLRECLLLQARAAGLEDSLAGALIRDCLPLIEGRKYSRILNRLACDPKDLSRALELIRGFSPRPGQKFASAQPVYVRPDVHIRKVEGEYQVSLNDDGLPKLKINRAYRKLLRKHGVSKETKSFIRERFRSAIELLRGVDQRQETIFRVCRVIVRHQYDFMESGIRKLKPLLIKDVADELGVHPSTISRVVANKYAHTPQGLMELRRFFSVGVGHANGENVSTMQVKDRLKTLIRREDPKKPLSDQKLTNLLNRDGIRITRRTVAKYRDQMRIPGSLARKKANLL